MVAVFFVCVGLPRELRYAPYACGTGFAESYDRGMKNTAPREWACAHGVRRYCGSAQDSPNSTIGE